TCATETLITIVRPGQFTGEINTISGRRALARIRARQDGEVIQLARENVLTVVQTDAELSEILMRAFILRRVELLAQSIGDATLVGSSHSSASRSTHIRISIWNAKLTYKAFSITFVSLSLRHRW